MKYSQKLKSYYGLKLVAALSAILVIAVSTSLPKATGNFQEEVLFPVSQVFHGFQAKNRSTHCAVHCRV